MELPIGRDNLNCSQVPPAPILVGQLIIMTQDLTVPLDELKWSAKN